jgi:hypothetical protein
MRSARKKWKNEASNRSRILRKQVLQSRRILSGLQIALHIMPFTGNKLRVFRSPGMSVVLTLGRRFCHFCDIPASHVCGLKIGSAQTPVPSAARTDDNILKQ